MPDNIRQYCFVHFSCEYLPMQQIHELYILKSCTCGGKKKAAFFTYDRKKLLQRPLPTH
jgi:hypothetical protein